MDCPPPICMEHRLEQHCQPATSSCVLLVSWLQESPYSFSLLKDRTVQLLGKTSTANFYRVGNLDVFAIGKL